MNADDALADRIYELKRQVDALGRTSQLSSSTVGSTDGSMVGDIIAESASTNDAVPDLQDDAADSTEAESDLQGAMLVGSDDLESRLADKDQDLATAREELEASQEEIRAAFAEGLQGLSDKVDTVVVGAGGSLILYSESDPVGTAPKGSTWFKFVHDDATGQGRIVGQWEQTGTDDQPVWSPRTVDSQLIANLDVGKLTAGEASISDLVAQKIAATTANLQTANVANLFVTEGATMKQAVIDYLFANVVQAKEIAAAIVRTAMQGTRVEIRKDETGRGRVYFYDDDNNIAGDMRGIAAGSVPPSGSYARQNGISFNGGGVFIGDSYIINPGTGPAIVKMQSAAALINTLYSREIRDPISGAVILGDTGRMIASLINGWGAGTAGRPPRYRFFNGWVVLSGFAQSTGNAVGMFTLPEGYRPLEMLRYIVADNDTAATTTVTVMPNGLVSAPVGSRPSLDSVQFIPGQ